MILDRVCRMAALVIAIVAVIDPAWMVAHPVPARAVVLRGAGATPADVARVRDALAPDVTIDTDEVPATAARVLVGRRAPGRPPDGLTFVVVPDAPADAPEIRRLRLGDRVPLDAVSRLTVDAALPPGATSAPAAVRFTLFSDDVPVDAQEVTVAAGARTATAALTFVPSREGLARIRVAARIGGGPEASAEAATEVVRTTRRILSYEARPSWSATFVRRVLEEDPRFEVVVRSVTSRGVTTEAGVPPATLDRADDLSGFDVVLVSAPDAVGDRAAEALEAYLRAREGAVVVLPDAGGAPWLSRLTGVSAWTDERRPALERIESPVGSWTASEFLWPAGWPAGAEAMTSCLSPMGAARRCAVWRTPVGGGRVVVNSAIDGWRTRTAEGSAFAAFWRSVIGDEAAATPRPVEVGLSDRLVEPGTFVAASVHLTGQTATPQAEWQSTEGAVTPVRLWPDGAGRYRAEFRAPDVPGRYRLSVVVPGSPAPQPDVAEFLVVDPGSVHRPVAGDHALLSAFATSRGGDAIPIADVGTLAARITTAVSAAPVATPTHPMRSPWWIVPFAGLLSVEWWSRRHRGAR